MGLGLISRGFLHPNLLRRRLRRSRQCPGTCWLAVDGQKDTTFVRIRLVERARMTPYEFTCAADAVVVVERAFQNIRLLQLRVLVEGQSRAGFPLQKASHFTFVFVFVKNLYLDAFELAGPHSIPLGST